MSVHCLTSFMTAVQNSEVGNCMCIYIYIYIKVKVKQSRYRPGVTQRVPGS